MRCGRLGTTGHVAEEVPHSPLGPALLCFIDGTFSRAKGRGEGMECTKAGKGIQIAVLVGAGGLPVAVSTTSASPRESRLVQSACGGFEFVRSEAMAERIIGGKAHDSDKLDDEPEAMGIEMIASDRANHRGERITQDERPLRRYGKRWLVERTIG